MYPNSFNSPFIMPNMGYNPMMRMTFPLLRSTRGGILSSFRNINFQGILNNVSRTLGVVKDAIPVVKEVRPMIGNMRSIIKLASVFNDVTDTPKNNNSTNINVSQTKKDDIKISSDNYINEPNFFL